MQQGPGAGTVLVESVASPSPWSAVRSKRVTILSRRRSSFLDLETTAAALAESEFKLVRTMEALDVLEKAHEALQEKHDKLIGHVTAIKADAVNTVWVYCPSKCHDFEHLPRVNPLLVESPDRAGEYELKHVVGKGQFSTVLAGLWAFGHGGPDGFSFGGGGTVAPPNTQSEANVELSAEEVKTAARLRPVTHPRKGVKVAIKVVAKGNVTSIEGAQRVVRELHALHLLKGE